ncbi:MAG: 4-hydroxy-tetrahydrodipicolinate reductase [Clostridiales bacterium]|nr:4-hydroxy-tetrahydrodipicolinate reductase [Clostridiales bacterium]
MNIFIVGICGKMGRALTEQALAHGVTVTGGLDRDSSALYPVFTRADDVNVPFDVIIDFSRPQTLPKVCALAEARRCPCVLATTGYSEKEEEQIAALSKSVPVFKSANMSIGVQALAYLTEKAARILNGFDIEIVERHHNQKEDAPSGTAKMLCSAAEKGLPYAPKYAFGREGIAPREKNEIGVHAVRGGTEAGTHEVCFYGHDESLILTHRATNRTVFADGALRAARFLLAQDAGLYGMHDLLAATFG